MLYHNKKHYSEATDFSSSKQIRSSIMVWTDILACLFHNIISQSRFRRRQYWKLQNWCYFFKELKKSFGGNKAVLKQLEYCQVFSLLFYKSISRPNVRIHLSIQSTNQVCLMKPCIIPLNIDKLIKCKNERRILNTTGYLR